MRSWFYHRSALRTADVEDLLAERGVIVSREAIRLWVNCFGRHFAAGIGRDRPQPNDKWHLDEVVIQMGGVKHWLWRAVDAHGDVLDSLVQPHRNGKTADRRLKQIDTDLAPRVRRLAHVDELTVHRIALQGLLEEMTSTGGSTAYGDAGG